MHRFHFVQMQLFARRCTHARASGASRHEKRNALETTGPVAAMGPLRRGSRAAQRPAAPPDQALGPPPPHHPPPHHPPHSPPPAPETPVPTAGADEGRQLNRPYRNKDYATNVLTFVYSQAPLVTADLLLCAPVIEREAQQQGKHLQAHYAHMLVHGTLHAQGWDHEGSADADAMQARETQIMQALGFTDPYAKQPG